MAVFFSTKMTGLKKQKEKEEKYNNDICYSVKVHFCCLSEDSWFLFHKVVSQPSGFVISNVKYSFSKRTELTIYCFS